MTDLPDFPGKTAYLKQNQRRRGNSTFSGVLLSFYDREALTVVKKK